MQRHMKKIELIQESGGMDNESIIKEMSQIEVEKGAKIRVQESRY